MFVKYYSLALETFFFELAYVIVVIYSDVSDSQM